MARLRQSLEFTGNRSGVGSMVRRNLHRRWLRHVCKVRQSAHSVYGYVIHFGGGDRLLGEGTEGVRDSAME